MDEILHAPDSESLSLLEGRSDGLGVSPRFGRGLSAAVGAVLDRAELVRRRIRRVFHRLDGLSVGRKLWNPAAFLATAGILGAALVLGTVYVPSYVVSVDGVELGLVREPEVFEGVMDRVEARATSILGYSYELGYEAGYEFALSERDALSSVPGLETYLFDQIDEVVKSYNLTVNGQFIGATMDRAPLEAMLDTIKAPYVNENTIHAEFVEPLSIAYTYTSSNVMQDLSSMEAVLTANTNGETTYEVQKGDTFMAIAYANDMSVDELQELNPGIDINRLYIGQTLTVRETIPYLSVRTVDAVTYHQAIPSPVEEVRDDTLYQGDRKVKTQGKEGEALVSAEVTYVNGREKDRTILSTTTLSEATTTVVRVGTKARPKTMATGKLAWPLRGKITSNYGYRYILGTYSFHSGLDIGGSMGTSIKAADGGKVVFAGTGTGSTWSYGNYVVIDHENGLQTIYAHCSKLLVKKGERVYQGQVIAKVGDTGRTTGPHLHFQVKVNGSTVNPYKYLNK